MPSLCVIFEAIGPYSGIGKVAMAQVEAALDAGWQVTVVAKRLHEPLQERVEWLKLYVPPRLFAFQWLTARFFIKRALGNRKFDVIHGHQPQIADLCDIFQCHYLSRVAAERNCLDHRPGWHGAFVRWQQRLVLIAEDVHYRRWNEQTTMVFCSELLRREFKRLYGMPSRETTLVNPCTSGRLVTTGEKQEAQLALIGRKMDGIVVGYLGGVDARKGFVELIQGLQGATDIFLLCAGGYTDRIQMKGLETHSVGLGLVENTDEFYAACDCLIVPSHFDPCPMVVFEAAARGLPVIATDGVGNLPDLLRHRAGMEWRPGTSLPDLIRKIYTERSTFREGLDRLVQTNGPDRYRECLLGLLDKICGNIQKEAAGHQ